MFVPLRRISEREGLSLRWETMETSGLEGARVEGALSRRAKDHSVFEYFKGARMPHRDSILDAGTRRPTSRPWTKARSFSFLFVPFFFVLRRPPEGPNSGFYFLECGVELPEYCIEQFSLEMHGLLALVAAFLWKFERRLRYVSRRACSDLY